jgi:cell division protein FtsB
MFRINLKPRQIISVVIIVAIFFLMMDLNTRLSELFRLSGQLSRMQTQIVNLQATEQALRKQLNYASSDAAVEEWARGDSHMAQPGDVVIVPVSPKGFTPTPEIVPTPTPVVYDNLDVWRALFLGE